MTGKRTAVLVAVTVVLAACSSGGASSAPSASFAPSAAPSAAASPSAAPTASAGSSELIILGAASLKGTLEDFARMYPAGHPGVTLKVTTAASSALKTQIEQGAPADVFLSADTKNPTDLATAGLADGPPVTFAGNTLVIIVPTGNPGGVTSPDDLAKPGLKLITAEDAVPISKYTQQVIANLAAQPDAPAGFEASVAANVVSKEADVKSVVAKIETGDGDAAIVYVTDAQATTKVATVAIPDVANVPATYAGVVIKASSQLDASHEFMTWVVGPVGQAILGTYGFLPPGPG